MGNFLQVCWLIFVTLVAMGCLGIVVNKLLVKLEISSFIKGAIGAIMGIVFEFLRQALAIGIIKLFGAEVSTSGIVVFLVNLRLVGIPWLVGLGFLVGSAAVKSKQYVCPKCRRPFSFPQAELEKKASLETEPFKRNCPYCKTELMFDAGTYEIVPLMQKADSSGVPQPGLKDETEYDLQRLEMSELTMISKDVLGAIELTKKRIARLEKKTGKDNKIWNAHAALAGCYEMAFEQSGYHIGTLFEGDFVLLSTIKKEYDWMVDHACDEKMRLKATQSLKQLSDDIESWRTEASAMIADPTLSEKARKRHPEFDPGEYLKRLNAAFPK
jgi:hypothetical protein